MNFPRAEEKCEKVPFRAVGFCRKDTVTFIDDELTKWTRAEEGTQFIYDKPKRGGRNN